jgi:hypothetical protein
MADVRHALHHLTVATADATNGSTAIDAAIALAHDYDWKAAETHFAASMNVPDVSVTRGGFTPVSIFAGLDVSRKPLPRWDAPCSRIR